ncbi:putative pectinesterase/pectinesterase inhibitor 12 [Bienertia sinuspersici]
MEIKSLCTNSPYPNHCFDTLKLTLSLNLPLNLLNFFIQSIQIALDEINRLSSIFDTTTNYNLIQQQKGTLQDCKELHQISLISLKKSVSKVKSSNISDARIYLSAALTNKDTCLEGLESAYGPQKPLLVNSIIDTYKHVSNSLSMLTNPRATSLGLGVGTPSWLRPRVVNYDDNDDDDDGYDDDADDDDDDDDDVDDDDDDGYEYDESVTMIVAKDGSGNFTSVQEAIDYAPNNSEYRSFIYVKKGIYEENVEIPSYKVNIVLLGDGSDESVITGSRSVADGWTTFRSATVAVSGEGFLARDLTFANTAGPEKYQAVALRINADLSAVYRCTILGYQDTLYVHTFRQFYRDCDIYGTVDYIFGNAAVVLQGCTIVSRMPILGQSTVITAQSRDMLDENTGMAFQNCTMLATEDLYGNKTRVKSFLGRPWRKFSRVVYMESYIDDFIDEKGWLKWSDNDVDKLNSLYYGEFDNRGPGAITDGREFGQLSKRRREERAEKFKKKILIAVICTILFLICIGGGVFAFFHFTKNNNHDSSKNDSNGGSPPKGGEAKTSNKIVEMLCDPTDYKKKCADTLTKVVHTNASNPSIAPRSIIKAAIAAAADEVVKSISKTEKFKFNKDEEKAAYEVCKKLFQDSVDELGASLNHAGQEVKNYHTKIDDLKTWLSAVYSYQETCIDAFDNGTMKNKIKEAVNASKEYISNSLALASQISTILDKFDAAEGSLKPPPRHLLAQSQPPPPPVDEEGFPKWVGHEERELAVRATTNLVANLTVAKDGSGNFTSINECLKSLPQNRTERIYIFVKEGIYEEYVTVTKKMVNITMFGDGSQKTVITGNKNFVDGVRTFETATFAVVGDGFVGIALGFNNTAGPEKHQAVALRVQADRSIFLNCRMEAYQDTLYAQAHRQFYRSCYISGTIDFIFGDASAIFQNCMIIIRKPMENQKNTVTAHGRADKHENTGIVIHNCRIYPDKDLFPVKRQFKSYLGRPWKQYARTIVMESTIGEVITPEGWMPWQGEFALNTLYYAEYSNHGPGSDTSKRVKWGGYRKDISRKEAQSFTVTPFLQGSWIRDNPTVQVHFGLYN